MSKKVIIAIVAGIVVVGGVAAGLVLLNNNKEEPANSQTSNTAEQTTANQVTSTNTSISSLLTTSDTKECTIGVNSENISGTMYFANNKMRADYVWSTDGKQKQGSMIILTDKQYVWDSSDKKGVMFAFSKDQIESQTSNAQKQSGVDVNKKYEFNCKSWNVDQSKFTPPADVKFTDFTKVQQQLQSLGQ